MPNLPHGSGVTDEFYNNWWQYIVNYDQAVKDLPPPGAPAVWPPGVCRTCTLFTSRPGVRALGEAAGLAERRTGCGAAARSGANGC